MASRSGGEVGQTHLASADALTFDGKVTLRSIAMKRRGSRSTRSEPRKPVTSRAREGRDDDAAWRPLD
jgi:hypothetical protein